MERTDEKSSKSKRELLHECNSDIYKIVDRLNAIGEDTYLAIPSLRSATTDVHKAITNLIDPSKPNNEAE